MKNKYLAVFAIMMVTLASCSYGGENKTNNNHVTPANTKIKNQGTGIDKLLNSQVCIVNDRFMCKDQIPVPVNDKTYYGCCEGCVAKIKNDSTSRYTSDPLTEEMVDKALAVIIVKPGTKDDVLYFKSETSVKKYIDHLQNK